MSEKTNPWTFDVRVRERNLKAGTLEDKELEKYLAQLPDLEGQVESFALAQPALDAPEDLEEPEEDDDDDVAPEETPVS